MNHAYQRDTLQGHVAHICQKYTHHTHVNNTCLMGTLRTPVNNTYQKGHSPDPYWTIHAKGTSLGACRPYLPKGHSPGTRKPHLPQRRMWNPLTITYSFSTRPPPPPYKHLRDKSHEPLVAIGILIRLTWLSQSRQSDAPRRQSDHCHHWDLIKDGDMYRTLSLIQ